MKDLHEGILAEFEAAQARGPAWSGVALDARSAHRREYMRQYFAERYARDPAFKAAHLARVKAHDAKGGQRELYRTDAAFRERRKAKALARYHARKAGA